MKTHLHANIDIAAVRDTLPAYASDIARMLLGEPNRAMSSRREWRFGNKGSLAIVIEGAKRGLWKDHETSAGGDLFALIQRERGGNFMDAVAFASDFVGLAAAGRIIATVRRPSKPLPVVPDDDLAKRIAQALAIWDDAKPISGTLAETYLSSRGIHMIPDHCDGGALRFHPLAPFRGERHPMMVGLYRDLKSNEPCGIHRTALTSTGSKIDRRALGRKGGAAIKLSRDEDVTLGLTVAEGVETALSGIPYGLVPVWALSDAGELGRLPAMSGIECLTVIVDNDLSRTGHTRANECRNRWRASGVDVRFIIPGPVGADLNEIHAKAVA